MRVPFVVLAIVALIPTAAAVAYTPEKPLATQLVGVEGVVLISWTPVPAAEGYVVYRGTTADDLQVIERTTTPKYLDIGAPADAVYGVSVIEGGQESAIQIISWKSHTGDCVSFNSKLHVSITVANCFQDGM